MDITLLLRDPEDQYQKPQDICRPSIPAPSHSSLHPSPPRSRSPAIGAYPATTTTTTSYFSQPVPARNSSSSQAASTNPTTMIAPIAPMAPMAMKPSPPSTSTSAIPLTSASPLNTSETASVASTSSLSSLSSTSSVSPISTPFPPARQNNKRKRSLPKKGWSVIPSSSSSSSSSSIYSASSSASDDSEKEAETAESPVPGKRRRLRSNTTAHSSARAAGKRTLGRSRSGNVAAGGVTRPTAAVTVVKESGPAHPRRVLRGAKTEKAVVKEKVAEIRGKLRGRKVANDHDDEEEEKEEEEGEIQVAEENTECSEVWNLEIGEEDESESESESELESDESNDDGSEFGAPDQQEGRKNKPVNTAPVSRARRSPITHKRKQPTKKATPAAKRQHHRQQQPLKQLSKQPTQSPKHKKSAQLENIELPQSDSDMSDTIIVTPITPDSSKSSPQLTEAN